MRVLLSDGSGLTSRQTATLLARAGHEVGVLTPQRLALARTTKSVGRWHRVPPYGLQPLAWAEAALRVLDAGEYDVLLPTQEQVAVLALIGPELQARGVATAVPSFAALRRVQDKLSAEALLVELGLARPHSFIAHAPEQLTPEQLAPWPVYLKAPIGTASNGVWLVREAGQLSAAGRALEAQGAFKIGGVLVQQPVSGPVLMVQAIFDRGRMLALHANRRDVVGIGGGAVHKTSVAAVALAPSVERIGAALTWHGALSFDLIDGPDGPVIIDINPRLVEPGNAAAAGLNLVTLLLDVATGRSPVNGLINGPSSRPGVRTHQLLLGLLTAAQTGSRRRVLRELIAGLAHRGEYAGSHEELTPLRGDRDAVISMAAISAVLLLAPGRHARLADGSVANYALTPDGWQQLIDRTG
jgi:glutathione synthase/RimK-type ligase-like ATP-grasp enzyme